MFPNNFGQQLLDALLHVLISIGRVLVLPLNLWVKSATNLVAQKKSEALDLQKIQSPWPYFSWVKRWILDFGFDAVTFLSYPLGALYWISLWFDSSIYNSYVFGYAFLGLITSLIFIYLFPLIISFMHDCLIFILLPINKLIDWLKKPAQYIEVKKNE